MSKKVLLITQNFYPVIGSSGNRNKNLFELLNKNGFDVTVLTTEPAYPNKNMYQDPQFWNVESLNKHPNIIRVDISTDRFESQLTSRLKFYLEITKLFTDQVKEMKKTTHFDEIIVSSPPIFIFWAGLKAKKLFDANLTLDLRDLWPESLKGIKKFHLKPILSFFNDLEKRMYNLSDRIIINSNGFRKHVEGKLKTEKPIIFLPNGAREDEMKERVDSNRNFRVIYTGNLGLAQDIDRIKLLIEKLYEEQIDLTIIGYGYNAKDLKHYVEEKQYDNVDFVEPTTREVCLDANRKSDLGIVFLNDEEVFSTVLPGKILDYLTCMTPVLGSVDGQSADLIENNAVGYVTRDRDIDKIVEWIKELKADPSKLESLKNNCNKLITENYLWEKNINRLVNLLT